MTTIIDVSPDHATGTSKLSAAAIDHAQINAGVLWFGMQAHTESRSVVSGPHPTGAVTRVFAGGYWLGGPGQLRPIRARIEPSGNHIAAVQPETGIFGVGDSLASAILDLRAALAQHLDVLEAEDALSEDLSSQLAFLREHLRRT